jgi:RNA polymerase sigma factor (TIGR02999 family)
MDPIDPIDPIEPLLVAATRGDKVAAAHLLPQVYAELKRVAGKYLSQERRDHTLQPTALVHEAYLRLSSAQAWHGRVHFLAAAAVAMRRVLVDHARRRAADKRAAGERIAMPTESQLDAPADAQAHARELRLLEFDELLEHLRRLDERKARVVELRFFGGLTNEQIADVLGCARSTVAEDWTVARAWLATRVQGD